MRKKKVKGVKPAMTIYTPTKPTEAQKKECLICHGGWRRITSSDPNEEGAFHSLPEPFGDWPCEAK